MFGHWYADFRFEGERVRKRSPVDTKRGAEEYERQLRAQLLRAPEARKEVLSSKDKSVPGSPAASPPGSEQVVPTFDEWFNGRFWKEWVVSRKNKPSEVEAKKSIYRLYLKPAFGARRLDEIRTADVAAFRANLVEQDLSEKRINNILTVLSKPLRYAVDAEVIWRAPKVGIFKVERPEIAAWELEEYARILQAAQEYSPTWYAAVCLAGEAGLRVGEIKALKWSEDVDLRGGTITIKRQVRQGIEGTPKGRTRRTVPMTATLRAALEALQGSAHDLVICLPDGTAPTDNQVRWAVDAICGRVSLPLRGWHILRHSFGTHAALFGVNPWRLMVWMGHKRIDETMRYVHVAEAHRRQVPSEILKAGRLHLDPEERVLAMLAARGQYLGSGLAQEEKSAAIIAA
jgi:integrase